MIFGDFLILLGGIWLGASLVLLGQWSADARRRRQRRTQLKEAMAKGIRGSGGPTPPRVLPVVDKERGVGRSAGPDPDE